VVKIERKFWYGSLNTISSYCQECTGPSLTATSSGGISGSPVAVHGWSLRWWYNVIAFSPDSDMNVIRIWISNSPQLSTAFQDIGVGVLNQSRLARFLKLRMDACPHLWKRSESFTLPIIRQAITHALRDGFG
jgi:hypothetical protein